MCRSWCKKKQRHPSRRLAYLALFHCCSIFLSFTNTEKKIVTFVRARKHVSSFTSAFIFSFITFFSVQFLTNNVHMHVHMTKYIYIHTDTHTVTTNNDSRKRKKSFRKPQIWSFQFQWKVSCVNSNFVTNLTLYVYTIFD